MQIYNLAQYQLFKCNLTKFKHMLGQIQIRWGYLQMKCSVESYQILLYIVSLSDYKSLLINENNVQIICIASSQYCIIIRWEKIKITQSIFLFEIMKSCF
jgi:hypothetical protein